MGRAGRLGSYGLWPVTSENGAKPVMRLGVNRRRAKAGPR